MAVGKINMKEWADGIRKSDMRPVIPIMTHPGIEIIGKTVYDAVTDGRVHYEAIRALAQKFPQAAATTVIMDLTVEAEAFGADIIFSENEVPTVNGRLLEDMEGVEKLEIPSLDKARLPQYLLANKLMAENNTSGKPVFAGCIGPFSLAGRLYEMTELMMACYVEPETAKLLLQKCTDFIIRYCKALKDTGVNGVIIAEPAAGLLSDDGCEEFSSVYVKQIVDEIQDDTFMIVLHNCGNKGNCTDAMLKTGSMGYHFGNQADMPETLKVCPENVLVMGNIDPVSVIKDGTPEQIEKEVVALLEKCGKYPNFVLSTGCDVPPEVPVENIAALYKYIS